VNISIDGLDVPGEGWLKRVVGTAVTQRVIIAGKGTGVPYRDAPRLVARYGGEFGDWQKVRGNISLDYHGVARPAEAHWAQEMSLGGPFEEKFKCWLGT